MPHVFGLNPDILVRSKYWPSLLVWSLNIWAGAALAYKERMASDHPPWTVIGKFIRGNPLGPAPRT